MGWKVINQPDGKYAIFSSVVDDLIYFDCNEEEVIEAFAQSAYESAKHSAELMMERHKIGKGFNPMSWEETVELIREIHKKDTDLDKLREEYGTDCKDGTEDH